jgi:hypothetical protein
MRLVSEVPPQDLAVDRSRVPTASASGFVVAERASIES